MKQTIVNIRCAYNDVRKFANASSNSGIVEFTNAVREISYQYYDELNTIAANGKNDIYKFIQKKMNEFGWTGYEFTKPIPNNYK